MKITILPPGPEPKGLSASAPVVNLQQHLVAFLCANNPHGFKPEDYVEHINEFSKLIMFNTRLVRCNVEQLRKDTKQLKKQFEILKLHQIYQIIANSLGYDGWTTLVANTSMTDGTVRNLNFGEIKTEADISADVKVSRARPRMANTRHVREFTKAKLKKLEHPTE